MKRVLVTQRMHDAGHALLDARDDVEWFIPPDTEPATLIEAVKDVDALAVRTAHLTADVLKHAKNLKVVSRHGVGCDSIDVDHCAERGIPVCIAAGGNAQTVVEHTMAMMTYLARGLKAQDAIVREGRWAERMNFGMAKDLFQSTMLIVGYGRIGKKLAPVCKAFGMDVVVADVALDRDLAAQQGVRTVTDFHDELANADYISLHVPLDDTTRNMIGPAELAAMKDGVILINNARGGVVDEAALAEALDSGKVFGAGLDVFSTEPPPADHPLTRHPNVILAPHFGAQSYHAVETVSKMAMQNILDAFDGCLKDEMIFNLDGLRKAGHRN
ncbi:MAG: hydroxyacid dehydrogenase [Rhodospirillaceae bacterium]